MLYLIPDNPRRDDLEKLHDMLVESVGDRFTLHNSYGTIMLFIPGGKAAVHGYYPEWPSVAEMHEDMTCAWLEYLLTGEVAKCGKALSHNN